MQIAARRGPEFHVPAASRGECPTRVAPSGDGISRTESSEWPRPGADAAQIPGNLEVKLDQINSQMASLGQALQGWQQNMVATSDLEALKNVWTRDVGHLSAQIKIVQTQVSTVVLPQLEVLLGTESKG